jgi:predicted amidohydrolase YtcJ
MSELVLKHGRIYTLTRELPQAEAMFIRDGKIIWVGENTTVDQFVGSNTEVVSLEGKTVIPGLIDAHIHLQKYAFSLNYVDCETPNLSGCLKRVEEKAKRTPHGEWILGHGWDQNSWDSYGTASQLDMVTTDHPVYLTAKSLHASWVNSRALHAAGISSATKDPDGGAIQRLEDNSPAGILFEKAMMLVSGKIPNPEQARISSAIEQAQTKLHAYGITSVHDFDGADCFRALQQLQANDKLTLRVLKNIPVAHLDSVLDLGLKTGFGNDFIRIGNVKLFSDGALGPRTAAMLAPYDHDEENSGILLLDSEAIVETGIRAVRGGLGLTVHAIGDRANHVTLDAYEEIRRFEAVTSHDLLPHRVEHLQVLHPDDLDRAASLGIIASMQPIHATSDMDVANQYWGERTRYAYAWKTQLKHGAQIYFGSDAPVESPNPFWGLHAAVTRQKRGSTIENIWVSEERISFDDALTAYTSAPGLAFSPTRIGLLRAGYAADLVLLDVDPFQIPPHELADVKPIGTIQAGQWVYRAQDIA